MLNVVPLQELLHNGPSQDKLPLGVLKDWNIWLWLISYLSNRKLRLSRVCIYLFYAGASGENWVAAPQGDFTCPKGLEYLASVDQLLVKQKVEVLEGKLTPFMITVWQNNRINLKDRKIHQSQFLLSAFPLTCKYFFVCCSLTTDKGDKLNR